MEYTSGGVRNKKTQWRFIFNWSLPSLWGLLMLLYVLGKGERAHRVLECHPCKSYIQRWKTDSGESYCYGGREAAPAEVI